MEDCRPSFSGSEMLRRLHHALLANRLTTSSMCAGNVCQHRLKEALCRHVLNVAILSEHQIPRIRNTHIA